MMVACDTYLTRLTSSDVSFVQYIWSTAELRGRFFVVAYGAQVMKGLRYTSNATVAVNIVYISSKMCHGLPSFAYTALMSFVLLTHQTCVADVL